MKDRKQRYLRLNIRKKIKKKVLVGTANWKPS